MFNTFIPNLKRRLLIEHVLSPLKIWWKMWWEEGHIEGDITEHKTEYFFTNRVEAVFCKN